MYSLDDWKRCWQTGHTPWRGELLTSDNPLLSLYRDHRTKLFGQFLIQSKSPVEYQSPRAISTSPALSSCSSPDTTPSLALRRAFVPLCGDSPAIRYLVDEGFSVTAVDFVEEPLLSLIHGSCRDLIPDALFSTESSNAISFPLLTPNLSLIQSDIFNLPSAVSDEAYNLVYDRAALIALPQEARIRYASLLANFTMLGGYLLLEVADMPGRGDAGPPYSVSRDEVFQLFAQFSPIAEETALPALAPEHFQKRGVTQMTFHRFIFRK